MRLKVDRESEDKGWDRAARVAVKLKGKKESFTALTAHFRGAPRNPLSTLELQEKVGRLTKKLLSREKSCRVIALVNPLEQLTDVLQLTSPLTRLSSDI